MSPFLFRLISTFCVLMSVDLVICIYTPNPDVGYPAGLLPECPGVTKNATIGAKSLPLLRIVLHSLSSSGKMIRKEMPLKDAHKIIAKSKSIDLKKKILVYACGYLDSSAWPTSLAMAQAYVERGYSVFVTETFAFYTYIYPKSVRISRVIGKMLGAFLVKLTDQGVKVEKLELMGVSLGAHTVSYAAKYVYSVTGKKPFRMTGLDPAGPCFKSLPPTEKFHVSDAQKVDVLHTNIDGFGTAERLGQVDFYANGGEFQPSGIPYIPCLVLCSHIRSLIYWWISIQNSMKFIGLQCTSVQDARLAQCYNSSVTNYLGPETDFSKPGIYYLPTSDHFPYYRGKKGLDRNIEIYKYITAEVNKEDVFEV